MKLGAKGKFLILKEYLRAVFPKPIELFAL
jgi:hypothetical protein